MNSGTADNRQRMSGVPGVYYLGFGLLEAWMYVTYIVSPTHDDSPVLFGGLTVGAALYALTSLVVAAGFAAIVLFEKRIGSIGEHPVVGAVLTALMCVGTIVASFLPFMPYTVIHLVIGVASAWLWMMWGEVFSRVNVEQAERVAEFSGIAEVLCVVLLMLLPQPALSIVAAFFPVVAYVFFILAKRDLDSRGEVGQTETHVLPGATKGKTYGRLLVSVGLPAFFVFMLAPLCLDGMMADGNATFILVGAVLFVASLMITLRHMPAFDFQSLYRLLASFVVAVCCLVALGVPQPAPAAVITGAWLSVDMFSWLMFARIYRDGIDGAIRAFALGQALIFSCDALGYFVGEAVLAAGVGQTLLSQICVVVVATLFAVLLVFHGGRRQEGGELDGAAVCRPADSSALYLEAAEHFGLSKREGEILVLLMNGRSAPFIRDELYISESTVRTHIRHIHGKLGVGTTQQAITKVHDYLGGGTR